MANLARPPVFGTPAYKYFLFNTVYDYDDCSSYIDVSYPWYRCGWMELPRGLKQVYSSDHIDNLHVKEHIDYVKMRADLYADDIGIFQYDAVTMSRDASFITNLSPDYALNTDEGCYLIVYVDGTGYTSPDTTGTVTIDGTDDGGSPISDVVTKNGDGSYTTSKLFSSIDASGISASGLSNCTVSLWGDIGHGFRRREMQIWCDTNNDGVYGLMYAGYVTIENTQVSYDDSLYRINGVGYDDYPKNTEYVAGYRSRTMCNNYMFSGVTGDCAVSSPNWKANGKCFVGDFDTHHPNGTVECGVNYRCVDFVDSTNPFPYDGYTYDIDYEDEAGQYYSPYPPNYFMGGLAIERMCQSQEQRTKVSRPTMLSFVAKAKLNGAISDTISIVSVDSVEGDTSTLTGGIYIVIENASGDREIVYTSGGYSADMGVIRARQHTEAMSFPDGSDVYFYNIGIENNNLVSEDDMLIEANINSTIFATMQSYVDKMQERMVNSEWVTWVDKYRQLHFSELYGDSLGHSTDFVIEEEDIASIDNTNISSVVNSVSANVRVADGTRYYPTLHSEDLAHVDPDAISVVRYGRNWKELSNKQLNGVGSTDLPNGVIGFYTYASNYLQLNAFPRHEQTVEILSTFVPDEHHWTVGNDPLLEYSDPYNAHIDLRTRRVTCPDYCMKDKPAKTFVVTGVEYKANSYGNIRVFINMSRVTTKDD